MRRSLYKKKKRKNLLKKMNLINLEIKDMEITYKKKKILMLRLP